MYSALQRSFGRQKSRKEALSAIRDLGFIFALFVTSETWEDYLLCRFVNLIMLMFYFITKMEAW